MRRNSEIDLIDIAYRERKNSETNNTRGCFLFLLPTVGIFPGPRTFFLHFPSRVMTLRRKITSTCNSAVTCNASLARYRKRHSRPLVTTALKRRSIFRRCVSSVLYAPRRLNPRGGPRLTSLRLLLFRALSRIGLWGRLHRLLSFSSSLPFVLHRRATILPRSQLSFRPRLSCAKLQSRPRNKIVGLQ